MDSGNTHRIRLVKCPKCRLLLPEPTDVLVYKCGGCSTILQVKNRKSEAKGKTTSSRLHETEAAAQMNESDRVSQVKECIDSTQNPILHSSGECSLDQNVSRDCDSENFVGVHASDEDRNDESDHNESQDCNIEQSGFSNEIRSSVELENEVLSPSAARATSQVEVNAESSLVAGTKSVADVNNESDSTFSSPSTDKIVARRGNNSIVTSHMPSGGSVSSEILTSSPDEQPEQPRSTVNHPVRRNDPFETTDYFSIGSELSGMSKCSTNRSSRAYYDGSVSSYDGIDDQVPDQHLKSYKDTYKGMNSVASKERTRRDKFVANYNSEMQHQARNLSSDARRHHHAMNYSEWDRDELLESTSQGRAVRNGTRFEMDDLQPATPFYQRDYPAGYESSSTSSQLHDELHRHSNEQDKIKLLRMVYELQEQLNRKSYVSEKANQRLFSGVTSKPYYSCEIPEEEISHDLNYRMYPERYRQGRNWPHNRIPFSAEATNNRHRIDSSYMHYRSQDRQRSAPLPPSMVSHNKGYRRFHPDHSCYDSYRSCPSSPPRFTTDAEFPIRYRETMSDDQRHEGYHMKKYMKEKPHVVKRHLRPIAGGAPFVTCYRCLKPLQLPADFLLFKRKFHQLRCGACSKVLKFSIENRIHIAPYPPKAVAPPLNEVDNNSDAVNRRNSASSSRANGFPQADPVSCSEDYELSYSKSYSTDGDPVYITSFNNRVGNADARNVSDGSSEERKQFVIPKRSVNKQKNPVETYESARAPTNKSRSSKVEELPTRTGSPLHRLMGYSSLSQVFKGSGASTSATSSHYT